MARLYKYTILKQDGTIEDLGVSPKKEFKGKGGLYELLNCDTIELIPSAYYKGKGHGRCTMFGDEEGRFKSTNVRNLHFLVLRDEIFGGDYDVVGDIIKEEVAK